MVNYRDTETSGRQPLLNALAALTREAMVTRLHLGGLSEPEVAEQLSQVTGWAVPGSVAAAVCARTRSNPFFVRELGRCWPNPPTAHFLTVYATRCVAGSPA